jgi:hypothetical protein
MAKKQRPTRTQSDLKEIRITELLSDRLSLRKKVKGLEEFVDDLKTQNQMLQASEVITPSQKTENQRVYAEFTRMNNEANEMAVALRQKFPNEIAGGKHAGQTLAQTVVQYLGRAKESWDAGYEAGMKAGKAEEGKV